MDHDLGGSGRRDVLRKMLMLGAAAPLAGTLARPPAAGPRQGSSVTSALARALDAGQLGATAFNAAVNRVSALRTSR